MPDRDYAAENKQREDAAKKELTERRDALAAVQAADNAATQGKPTPTPEEIDLSMMGVHVIEHEHDGSDYVDPVYQHMRLGKDKAKTSEAAKPQSRGSYQTRTVPPASTPT